MADPLIETSVEVRLPLSELRGSSGFSNSSLDFFVNEPVDGDPEWELSPTCFFNGDKLLYIRLLNRDRCSRGFDRGSSDSFFCIRLLVDPIANGLSNFSLIEISPALRFFLNERRGLPGLGGGFDDPISNSSPRLEGTGDPADELWSECIVSGDSVATDGLPRGDPSSDDAGFSCFSSGLDEFESSSESCIIGVVFFFSFFGELGSCIVKPLFS